MTAAPADRLVARLRAAGCVFAEDEAALLRDHAADQGLDDAALDRLVERRAAGEPLEQVVGWAEVAGIRVRLRPGVFVPRRRTALLVEAAEAAVREAGVPRPVVVELCCGSGAVAAALGARLDPREVHASDVDPVAVACARDNLPPAPGRVVEVHVADLDAALPARLESRVDVLAAHAPYVPSARLATLPPEARDHEPRHALDGGGDGLEVVRRVLALAPRWLAPTGVLVLEAADDQLPALTAAADRHGLRTEVVRDDDRGALVVLARPA